MSNGKMHDFIQAMYGTVLGVSFFTVFGSAFNTSLKDKNTAKEIIDFFKAPELLFTYALFGFTVTILAHDWLSYNNNEDDKKNNFAAYLPQIASLFFVAQMFSAAANSNLKLWFFYAIFYTLANIAGFIVDIFFNTGVRLAFYGGYAIIYMVHIFITVCGFCHACSKNTAVGSPNVWLLVAVIVIVAVLWQGMKYLQKIKFAKK